MILTTVVGGLFSLATEWFTQKREEKKAIHQAKMARVQQEGNWEEIMAEGSLSSWKDEYLTIIFTMPFLLLWVSALFDIPWLADRVERAFQIVNQVIPAEYWWLLGAIAAASFGIRKLSDLFSNIRK